MAATHPLAVQYLLPIRAEGDFLARLGAQPDSVRAKLERYVLVTYPTSTDFASVLATLRADPYVAVANEPKPLERSSAALIGFEMIGEAPSGSQHGCDELKVEAA